MVQIFIGGTGRSGTSILKRVMKQHSQISAIHNELRVLIDPDGALDLVSALVGRWSPNRADTAIRRFENLLRQCEEVTGASRMLKRLEQNRRWPLSIRGYAGFLGKSFGQEYFHERVGTLIDQLVYHSSEGMLISSPPFQLGSQIREAGPFKLDDLTALIRRFFDDLYQHRAISPSISKPSHWLDDTPYNLLHAGELLEVFPKMKFIHIYRDPRDVLASYYTKVWGGIEFEVISKRLGGIYRRWFDIRESLPEKCFFEISLESLAEDPRGVLTRICAFLELPFEDGLLSVSLDKAHTGRWKSDIPASGLKASLPTLKQAMSHYGYE